MTERGCNLSFRNSGNVRVQGGANMIVLTPALVRPWSFSGLLHLESARLSRTYFHPATWQTGGRFRRAEPGAPPRLPGMPQHTPGAGFHATLSNFQNLQITSWCSSLLRLRAVEVPKKAWNKSFSWKKVPQKNSRGPQLAANTSHAWAGRETGCFYAYLCLVDHD